VGERGSAQIFFALCLTVLLGSVALVTDTGLVLFNKAVVANAADAAALAGVQALPADRDKAIVIAGDYAARNNVENVQVIVSEDKRRIEVHAEHTINLLFARVLGLNTSTAQAHAAARAEPLTGVRGVVPLGLTEQNLIFGENYYLKYAAGDDPEGEYHSGFLGILALQGPGAKLYVEDLKYGFEEITQIGNILNIQTGNISGNTYEGVNYRIGRCTHSPACTPESYAPDCARLVTIPIIRPYADKQVQVVGFAAFFVEAVTGMGNDNNIIGKFVYSTVPGESSPDAPDTGMYVPRLIE